MNTVNLMKKGFGIGALSCIALMAGPAQAHGWGQPNSYLPVSAQPAPHHGDRHGLDDRFAPALAPRLEVVADIDQRQQRQARRIRAGFDSGQLSRHEARDLLREQRHIEKMQRRYLADGRLSRDEWRHLDAMLDRASVNIREERHDRNWR